MSASRLPTQNPLQPLTSMRSSTSARRRLKLLYVLLGIIWHNVTITHGAIREANCKASTKIYLVQEIAKKFNAKCIKITSPC